MKLPVAFAAMVLLCACEAKVGKDAERETGNEAVNAAAPAEGENGKFSLNIPGFEMKVDMPDEGIRTDEDSDILYPGSRVTGMTIDAGRDSPEESVEIRFRSPDPVRQVADWYRDPARGAQFSVTGFAEEADGYRLSGTQKDGNDGFDLWMSPVDGGTDGRLVLRDRK